MNEKRLKSMRFYLVLPLLVLPFITVAFWLMGGGTVASVNLQKKSGLNTALPDAHIIQDSGRDKMSFYEMAAADSAKRTEQVRNDPNLGAHKADPIPEEFVIKEIQAPKVRSIRERIKMPAYSEPDATPLENPLVPRAAQRPAVDPDLEAINQTIEKLAALQRPEKASRPIEVEKKQVLSVLPESQTDDTYFGKKTLVADRRQFLNGAQTNQRLPGSFSASVPAAQVIQAGSVLSLQLNQNISIGGSIVPAGTMVYGIASLESERLFIQIASIQSGGVVYPVALSVFDMDGIEGIHVPGSVGIDVIKSSADQSLQSVNVLSLDPSIKTQAAIAGIGAAKNLLSRKVKAVRVTIGVGYRVLLKENKLN